MSKADASTQNTVDLFEEAISSHSQKFSQGSQTENLTVTDSSQTNIYIPSWLEFPNPPPIEEILGVPEIDNSPFLGTNVPILFPFLRKLDKTRNISYSKL